MALCRVHTSIKGPKGPFMYSLTDTLIHLFSSLLKRREKKSPESVFFLNPDPHQELMGSVLDWDPSSIIQVWICSVVFVCDSADKPTETGENRTSEEEVRRAVSHCINYHPVAFVWVAHWEVSINSKGYNSVQFSHHGLEGGVPQ